MHFRLICVLFLVLTGFLGAQDIVLKYADPDVQVYADKTWKAARIGQTLSPDMQLKVPATSLAILAVTGAAIQVKEGVYPVQGLLKSLASPGQELSANIQKKVGILAKGSSRPGVVAGGVRAEDKTKTAPKVKWVDDGSPADLIKSGTYKLENSRYSEAMEDFSLAIRHAGEQEQLAVRQEIASICMSLQLPVFGTPAVRAWDPPPSSVSFGDWSRTKAMILVSSEQHADLLAWIDGPLNVKLPAELKQQLLAMKALAQLGLQDQAGYEASIKAAVEVLPTSELAAQLQTR